MGAQHLYLKIHYNVFCCGRKISIFGEQTKHQSHCKLNGCFTEDAEKPTRDFLKTGAACAIYTMKRYGFLDNLYSTILKVVHTFLFHNLGDQRMDKVSLEVVIISAHDLKCVTSFGRPMRTYAVVWSDSTTQNSTRTDRKGGRYPTWNDKFQTTVNKGFLQQKGSALLVKIYCKTMMGKKRVGSARMPYSDILEGYTPPDSMHFVSYRIRRPNGRPRGTLDLSVRFLDKMDPSIHNSRPQFQMKFPSFPSRQRTQASSSSQGYAIGAPLSNSHSSMNSTNASYGYQHHGRLPPFNLQVSAASYNAHHSQFPTYL